MKRILKSAIALFEAESNDKKVRETVENFIEEIKNGGDKAVREISRKLDNWSPESFKLSKSQIIDIIAGLPSQVITDIEFAQTQIRNFAQHQKML